MSYSSPDNRPDRFVASHKIGYPRTWGNGRGGKCRKQITRDELGSPALWAGRKSSACRRQAQPWLCSHGSMTIKRTSHAVYDTKYHLVWAPKYRRWIMREDIRQ